MAENLAYRGIEVTIVEMLDQVNEEFDTPCFESAIIHRLLRDGGHRITHGLPSAARKQGRQWIDSPRCSESRT